MLVSKIVPSEIQWLQLSVEMSPEYIEKDCMHPQCSVQSLALNRGDITKFRLGLGSHVCFKCFWTSWNVEHWPSRENKLCSFRGFSECVCFSQNLAEFLANEDCADVVSRFLPQRRGYWPIRRGVSEQILGCSSLTYFQSDKLWNSLQTIYPSGQYYEAETYVHKINFEHISQLLQCWLSAHRDIFVLFFRHEVSLHEFLTCSLLFVSWFYCT